MVASLNSKVDLVSDATSFYGMTAYGKIMVGDRAFEFYHDRDQRKFIQIPWNEVEYVTASVYFKGKWIPRFAIATKRHGMFSFASKKPKETLRAINRYIPREQMLHSLSFFDVLKRRFKK